MQYPILKPDFYQRDTLIVAQELLGKFLVAGDNKLMITEVEAYDGPEDLASHASKGRTKRTEVMFGEAGVWYVYLVYGMYWMLNMVTGDKDYPAAVLIRGAGDLNGPGKLTRALGITGKYNACPAKPEGRSGGLYIEDRGVIIPKTKILTSPRVGVDYAGLIWSQKPYRFLLK